MDITAVDTALERLHALAAENPGIQDAANFYMRLIPTLAHLRKNIPAITIDPLALEQKFAAGVSILVDEILAFDSVQSRHVFQAIGAAVEGVALATGESDQGKTAAQKASDIRRAVEMGGLDPLPLLMAVESGEAEPVEEPAYRLGLDAQMLELLAQNTLKVFLRAWREALETQVDLDAWRHSPCPFCGADAALAEIRGVESARYLRCLRCGAGWPYPNLRCAFCGNADHKTLGVLLVEGPVRKYYVHTCDRCNRYLKTIITFEAIPADLLIVEDLATLQFDWLASERGYLK